MANSTIGRNDRCPCGSGKKYKHCCLTKPSAAALLISARQHHEAGLLNVAVKLYEQVFQADPKNVEALHLMSILASQVGEIKTAERLIRQLLSVNPDHAEALSNLAIVLQGQGRIAEAIACCEKVIALKPEHAEAHNTLGNLLLAGANAEQAIASYRRALALNPRYADAHYNIGNALQQQGKWEAAEQSYRQAITTRADFAEAHNNLGIVLRQQERYEEACSAFEKALSIRPEFPDALNNLGVALHEMGKCDAAAASYRKLIAIQPNHADGHFNMGSALHELDRLEDAIAAYKRALEIKPDFRSAYSNLIYLYASTCCVSPQQERALAEGWERAALSEAEREAARGRRFHSAPRHGRKLKLGIMSAEIGEHAVADFLEPLLTYVDRQRFEVILFPTRIREGQRSVRMQAMANSVVPLVGVSDASAAEMIRAAEVDILMDTTGHTRGCRLGILAHRAAPVQLSYLGYWSTSGLTEMDWFIADGCFPTEYDSHFRERLWRLPRVAVAYRGDSTIAGSQWQPSADGRIWLGSFNRYQKIRSESVRLWAKVMNALPNSKLLLEDRATDDSDAHQRIVSEFARYGIAAERVEFEAHMPGHERHMRLYDRLDIALDTIPFNSGTTACDALWMGVPLVALEGNRSASRMASTFLKAIGRPEWVARDEDDYVANVIELANNIALRTELRTTQRDRMARSALCDAAGLARALEDGFEQMFDEWQSRQSLFANAKA